MFDVFGPRQGRHRTRPARPYRDGANRLSRRALAWSLGVSLALTVAGCGSARPLTRAQLIKRANAICDRVHAKMKAIGPADTPARVAFVARKLAGFQQQELEQMRRLRPPSSLASDWKKIVEGAQELTVNVGTLSTDVQLKKTKQMFEELKQVGEDQKRIAVIVKRDGLTNCVRLD
jgi:hypothetical protein